MTDKTDKRKKRKRGKPVVIKVDRWVSGMMYAVQQMVLYADQPGLAIDYLLRESGISKEEFVAAQLQNGHENEKMMEILNEAFDTEEDGEE